MKRSPRDSENARQRNYRARQRHVSILDVRIRPRVRNRIWRRRALIYGLPLLTLVLVIWAIQHFSPQLNNPELLKDPDYVIRTISVETDGALSRQQILQMAQVREGGNIWEVDLKQVHQRLLENARLRDARVWRELPDKLCISVSERRPVAFLARSTGSLVVEEESAPPASFMVDNEGVVLEIDQTVDEGTLPTVLIESALPFSAGEKIETSELQQSVRLLELINQEMTPGLLRVVLVDTARNYALDTVADTGTRITFGRSQLKEQIERLGQLLQFFEDTGRQVQYLNLMTERNTPARFGPPTEPPKRPIRRAGIVPSHLPVAAAQPVDGPPAQVAAPIEIPAAAQTAEVRPALPVSDPPQSSPFKPASSLAESDTHGER